MFNLEAVRRSLQKYRRCARTESKQPEWAKLLASLPVQLTTEQNVSVVNQAEAIVDTLSRNVSRMGKSVNQFIL
ncbi:hypothetical protein AZKH_2892 [Azoarcus sp. KH32C]|nr:hypothetical protein AZKH_2892 [Azoarcus sp. KH32C]